MTTVRLVCIITLLFACTGIGKFDACAADIQPILRLDTGAHMGQIRKIIVSQDGKYFLTASLDKTVRLWDSKTMKELRKFLGEIGEGPEGTVDAIALSPDNRHLAVGGWFGKDDIAKNYRDLGIIRLYDFESGKLIKLLKDHVNVVHDIIYSPDGRLMASVSADTKIIVRDTMDYKIISDLPVHSDELLSVRFIGSKEKLKLVTGGKDGLIVLYSITLTDQNIEIKPDKAYKHKAPLLYLAVSDKYIATSYEGTDNQILIFDSNLNLLKTILTESSAGLSFSPDNRWLLAGRFINDCKIYDSASEFSKVSSFNKNNNTTGATAFLNSSVAVTAGGERNDIYFWNVLDGKEIDHIVGSGNTIRSLGLIGNDLAYGITRLDPSKLTREQMIEIFPAISDNSKSPNSDFDVTKIRNINTESAHQKYSYKLDSIFNINSYTFKPISDAKFIPLPLTNGSLSVYSSYTVNNGNNDVLNIYIDNNPHAKISKTNTNGFRHYTYGLVNNIIITGGEQGYLTGYNSDGEPISEFAGHEGLITSLASDGFWLVSGSDDQTIKLWNVKDIEKIKAKKVFDEDMINQLKESYKRSLDEIKKDLPVPNMTEESRINIVKDLSRPLDELKRDPKFSKNFKYVINSIKPTLSLFISKNNEWVMWTEEGYFNASPGGAKYVGYHINQGPEKEAYFVPLNNLYDVFYRPDIIQAKLRGDDIRGLITITAEEALKTPPPTAKFTSIPSKTSEKKVKVCYQVKSSGGGIGEVRLFQNGKLIKSDGFYREVVKRESVQKVKLVSLNSRAIYQEQRGLAIREKKTASAAITKSKGDQINECIEIESITGENEISLAAFNAPNTVQGFMESASFTSARKVDESHLYILSVGIDTYRDSSINLKFAAKDAKDFIAKLSEKARSIYRPQNIHLITLTNQQAGKKNIMKAINDLSAKVKHGDGFIFFNASHGVLLQNQYYIVTADFNGDLANTNSLISSNEIVDMSKRIKSLSQLFIFDTCHAGGVDNIISGLYDARMVNLARKMGLHIYASAGSVQTALDGYQGNGLYTHTLLQGIANGNDVDKEKSGKVTVKNLGLYTKEKTTEISTKLGHPQTPFIINYGRDNSLFTIHLADQKFQDSSKDIEKKQIKPITTSNLNTSSENNLRIFQPGDYINYKMTGFVKQGGVSTSIFGTAQFKVLDETQKNYYDQTCNIFRMTTDFYYIGKDHSAKVKRSEDQYYTQDANGSMMFHGKKNNEGLLALVKTPSTGWYYMDKVPFSFHESSTQNVFFTDGSSQNRTDMIVGVEQVSVPAGVFKAYKKISNTLTTKTDSSKIQAMETTWLEPKIGPIRLDIEYPSDKGAAKFILEMTDTNMPYK